MVHKQQASEQDRKQFYRFISSRMTAANMNLPHTKDGTLDYKTLGNMISASLLGEVVYANAVDREHCRDPATLISSPTSDMWQFYYKENDVVVLKKKIPHSKMCCFMGRGVIDAPMENVVSYLQKFQNRLEYDETLLQLEVCQQFSDNDWLLYMAHKAKQCFFTKYRDFLYYCRTSFVDGKYVQSDLSVEDKDYPHRPPYIRGEMKQGTGWVVEKYNDSECSSLVSYVAHLDLKELPPVIANRVLRRQPMAIKYIRERVMKPKVPLNFDAAFIDSSQLQFSEEDQKYEEYTSMNEFIENIDIVDTKKKESTNKRKVKINIEGDTSSEEVVRPRFYTNSLPDLNDQEVNGSPSCASSYYSARASSVEVTVAIIEPNITTINGTTSDSKEEATSSAAGENGVINEELSVKAMQANSVAQEFPSYNQWSGNGGEVPIENSPNDGHNLTTT